MGAFDQGNSVDVTLDLQAGSNSVAFGASSGYAELDRVIPIESTVYESEAATVTDATIATSPTASNQGYVKQIDNPTSSVSYSVWVPLAGNYTFRQYFANNSGGVATDLVNVNGAPSGSVSYDPSKLWGEFRDDFHSDFQVNLNAGINTITLSKGANYAELDKLERVPNEYEAEEAKVTGAQMRSTVSASGKRYVGGIDNAGNSVSFKRVLNEGATGTYTLRVYYTNGGGSPATHLLTVNHQSPITVTYAPTPAWGTFAAGQWVDIPITLEHGYNVLTFSKAANYAELDLILIH
ncbi:CBM35 domain-containing protein [Naasia aerilata]|uniref:CBM6 domain-containing protein n=1 Tax=Naasia aerilata TaxID=1162966 RepID=A0ABN6XRK0_9MICO|nr:CBM35 domain-containing protein [Naasia aerilata]BDZ47484.1 hypothetical protein GCM10025866_33930 [Naasia aerilata]